MCEWVANIVNFLHEYMERWQPTCLLQVRRVSMNEVKNVCWGLDYQRRPHCNLWA